jgi:hypothetical protein
MHQTKASLSSHDLRDWERERLRRGGGLSRWAIIIDPNAQQTAMNTSDRQGTVSEDAESIAEGCLAGTLGVATVGDSGSGGSTIDRDGEGLG